MARGPLTFLTDPDGDRTRSILRDLRSGRAGAGLRGGLSLAAVAMWMAPAFFVLGLMDASPVSVRDYHVGWAMSIAALGWGGTLIALWWSYQRFRHLIRAVIILLCVWAVAIPAAVGLGESIGNSEYLIASVIFTAIAVSVATIACAAYLAATGRSVTNRLGEIIVHCPACQYSMVGLESTTCPECGAQFTIDAIIRAQEYGADPLPGRRPTGVAVASPRLRLEDGESPASEGGG